MRERVGKSALKITEDKNYVEPEAFEVIEETPRSEEVFTVATED